LDAGQKICILIRDMRPDEKNPFTTEQTVSMIEKVYEGNENVKVMVIPDIESVNYGRGVGYEINEFVPPENINNISATFIRESIKNGNNDWKKLVDEKIHQDIVDFLDISINMVKID